MLTDLDESVLARINLHAVFGALPRLVELVPEARMVLEKVSRPLTLTVVVRGVDTASYRFTSEGIAAVESGSGARLLTTGAAHFNAVVEGTKQPIPLAGPRGLSFLTGVFAPLTDLLGRYLQPSEEDLANAAFSEASTLLTLDVVAHAIVVVGNEDRSGRFSAAHMPDGTLDLEVGSGDDALRYRVAVADHTLALSDDMTTPPRAALTFSDLATVGGVLGGTESAIACIAEGRLAMRGFIPLVDNTNRILDRVGAYLGG